MTVAEPYTTDSNASPRPLDEHPAGAADRQVAVHAVLDCGVAPPLREAASGLVYEEAFSSERRVAAGRPGGLRPV